MDKHYVRELEIVAKVIMTQIESIILNYVFWDSNFQQKENVYSKQVQENGMMKVSELEVDFVTLEVNVSLEVDVEKVEKLAEGLKKV